MKKRLMKAQASRNNHRTPTNLYATVTKTETNTSLGRNKETENRVQNEVSIQFHGSWFKMIQAIFAAIA